MNAFAENGDDSEIYALFEAGQTFEVIASRFRSSREGIRQRIESLMGRLANSSRALRASQEGEDIIGDLAEAVIIGDDDGFFWTLEHDSCAYVRWYNPSASDGEKQVAALQDDLIARATSEEGAATGGRVVLVLDDSSAMNRAVLHALIVKADELIIVASRTTLRKIIRTPNDGSLPFVS